MDSIAAALSGTAPREVTFDATVVSRPHYFFGSRTRAMHEAFDVRSGDGARVELVGNVSLAPRVPVAPGDRIAVRGELVPQTRYGPLVHWTHHDPAGLHPGGYIDFAGRRYA